MSETILVTGGFGFIGSNFTRYLHRTKKDVTIINLDKLGVGSDKRNLEGLDRRLISVKGNIRSKELLKRLLKRVDKIVHFAAETHVDRSIANPRAFFHNNAEGTLSLLESLRKYKDETRLVHVSTDEVYGEATNASFEETDALKPSNPYSASKAAADMLVLGYARTYGLNASIVRCTNNFGPYQSPEKMIPKCVISALLGIRIPVYGKGENVRDWLYVEDNCEAISLVLDKGTNSEIYNVSARNEIRNIDLVRRILNLMRRDEKMIEFTKDRPGHDSRYSLNSNHLRTQLNWRPRHRFEESLKLTIDWYSQNTAWWRRKVRRYVLPRHPWEG